MFWKLFKLRIKHPIKYNQLRELCSIHTFKLSKTLQIIYLSTTLKRPRSLQHFEIVKGILKSPKRVKGLRWVEEFSSRNVSLGVRRNCCLICRLQVLQGGASRILQEKFVVIKGKSSQMRSYQWGMGWSKV